MKSLSSGVLLFSLLALFMARSEGQIIYSGDKHISILYTEYRILDENHLPSFDPLKLNLDLNSDGVNDFALYTFQPFSNFPEIVFFGGRGLNGTRYGGQYDQIFGDTPIGFTWGVGPQWSSIADGYYTLDSGQNWWQNGYTARNASPSGGGFAGLRFVLAGEFHYAWIKFERPSNDTLVIDGWAIQSAAGVPIANGDTGITVISAVPEPSTYGLMGTSVPLLLVSLRRLRRKSV